MKPNEPTESMLHCADRLRAHPAFDAAVERYALGVLEFRRAPWIVNKLVSHDARWRVIGYLLYLHTDRDLYGPEGGATYSRLLDLCTRRQEVSPRVTRTVLTLMQITGFIQSRQSDADGRVRFYQPTERMGPFMRLWLKYGVEALDLIEPEWQRTKMLREDPGFIDRFLVSGGRAHICETPPADHLPEFTSFFARREGAFTVIVIVMLAEFENRPVASRTAVAKEFGLSKSQVSNVFVKGAECGFFELDSIGIPRATAKLRDMFRRWVAVELAFYARHMLQAPVQQPLH